jgi:WD40 repeat protein/class 3 adenylate cyclase/tRNA A-37 threonylcarbamoyl transferase component Bud32
MITNFSDVEPSPRSGLVTVLFTDMVGSTALKQKLGDRASSDFFDQHHRIIRETLAKFAGGEEIETAGDSFLITFGTPSDAIQFALLTQSRLGVLAAEQTVGVLDRIGIFVGEVVIKENETGAKPRDLFGIPIDICARIMSLATGGQTLMSRFAFDAARPMLRGDEFGALQWLNHGPYLLKGIEEPIEICEVRAAGAPTSPPTSNDKASRVSSDGSLVLGWRPALAQLVPDTRWKLIAKLGEGGFGEVWLGEHEVLKEKRVFKFCFQAELVRSLKRELTLFRILKEKVGEHPNIATIREFNFDTAPYFIEMEYVAGHDLKAWLQAPRSDEQISERNKLEIISQVAEALQAAHQCGIVHRDVKPGNILVSDGDAVAVKLTDFGIGQVLSEEYLAEITRAGFTQTMLGPSSSGTGTQMYMAPEILAGKPASPRSDVYSLGVVLYQILIGDFSQAVTIDWERHIADPLLREDLHKCLAGDPNERFESAADLARSLRALPQRRKELARTQANLALREKAAYRRGLIRAATLAASIVVVLIILAAVAFKQARRAKQNERAAKRLLYDSDMYLAQQTLKLNNLGNARRVLDRHRPLPGEEDLRGWEWRYLWQLTRSAALATLTNRPTRGISTSFSPDGRIMAAGWWDGRVDLWDVSARKLIKPLIASKEAAAKVAFSPIANLLAATDGEGRVILFDIDTGNQTATWTLDANPWSCDLSFSKDGSKLVILNANSVRVIDVSTRQAEFHHSVSSTGDVFDGVARISPDKSLLYVGCTVSVSNSVSFECLDLRSGQSQWRTEPGYDVAATALDVSPDGRFLASGSGYSDPLVRIWDARTGHPVARLEGHSGWISKVIFTPDSRHLISSATDQTIRFWDTATWTETKVLRGHTDEIHALAFSAVSGFIASASKNGDLMLWRTEDNSQTDGYMRFSEQLMGPPRFVDHSRLLLLKKGSPPIIKDLKAGGIEEPLLDIKTSEEILGVIRTNIICQWNGSDQILLRELNGKNLTDVGKLALNSAARPSSFLWYTTGEAVWTEAAAPTSIFVSRLSSPARKIELKNGDHHVALYALSMVSKNGKYLIGRQGRNKNGLVVWDIEKERVVCSIEETFRVALFAEDGDILVVNFFEGEDTKIVFYNLKEPGRPPRVAHSKHSPYRLAVSPDGHLVASSSESGVVRLYASDGTELGTFTGHLNAAFAVAFSADGQRLLSTCGGREAVKIWDVLTHTELLNLSGKGSELQAARWSPDGDLVLAGPPWQAWVAPSFEQIAAAEAQAKKAESADQRAIDSRK